MFSVLLKKNECLESPEMARNYMDHPPFQTVRQKMSASVDGGLVADPGARTPIGASGNSIFDLANRI